MPSCPGSFFACVVATMTAATEGDWGTARVFENVPPWGSVCDADARGRPSPPTNDVLNMRMKMFAPSISTVVLLVLHRLVGDEELQGEGAGKVPGQIPFLDRTRLNLRGLRLF